MDRPASNIVTIVSVAVVAYAAADVARRRSATGHTVPLPFSASWAVAAVVVGGAFVALLGPGIRLSQ